ncbi:hypothetical protein DENSPDRAFT_854320 [Dentipellis sp. KUC8613]|nr:hypothetical protein DENSPDRAFT_854320 [Dentipellis sp. KUC8613]
MARYRLQRQITGFTDSINVIAFSPNAAYCASGGEDGILRVFTGDFTKERSDYIIMESVAKEEIYSIAQHGSDVAIACGPSVYLFKQGTLSSLTDRRVLPAPPTIPGLQALVSEPLTQACELKFANDELVVAYVVSGIVGWNVRYADPDPVWRIVPRATRILHSSGEKNIKIPIVYIHGGDFVVIGSSFGTTLRHGEDGSKAEVVQAMAYAENGRERRIVTGTSDQRDDCVLIAAWTGFALYIVIAAFLATQFTGIRIPSWAGFVPPAQATRLDLPRDMPSSNVPYFFDNEAFLSAQTPSHDSASMPASQTLHPARTPPYDLTYVTIKDGAAGSETKTMMETSMTTMCFITEHLPSALDTTNEA